MVLSLFAILLLLKPDKKAKMNTLIEMVSNSAEFIMMKAGFFGAIIILFIIFIVWFILFVSVLKFYDLIVYGIYNSKMYIRDYKEHRRVVRRMIKMFGAPYKVKIWTPNGKLKEKKYYF